MYKKLLKLYLANVKGFTLIELLVVLGILGILAAALLAAINPVEQLRKGQDTSMKNIATEFVDSSTSYYSTVNALPWFSANNGGAGCYSAGNVLSATKLSDLAGCITTLVNSGELKASFSNQNPLTLQQIFITNPNPQSGNATDVVACFQPQSNSQQLDPNTKYSQTGALATQCKSQGGTNNCYWCAE